MDKKQSIFRGSEKVSVKRIFESERRIGMAANTEKNMSLAPFSDVCMDRIGVSVSIQGFVVITEVCSVLFSGSL